MTFLAALSANAQSLNEPTKLHPEEGLFTHTSLKGFVPSKESRQRGVALTPTDIDREAAKDRAALADAFYSLLSSNKKSGDCRFEAKKIYSERKVVTAISISIFFKNEAPRTMAMPIDQMDAVESVSRPAGTGRDHYQFRNVARQVWSPNGDSSYVAPELDVNFENAVGKGRYRKVRLNIKLKETGEIHNLFFSSSDEEALRKIEADAIANYPAEDQRVAMGAAALRYRDNVAKANGVLDLFHCQSLPDNSVVPKDGYRGVHKSKFIQPDFPKRRTNTMPWGFQ